MPSVFEMVRQLRPGRSRFNLSYAKTFTCDFGQLIPVMADEVVPGDSWRIGAETVVRMQPMVAPVLHEINVFVHYFFVPYRLLWPKVDGSGNDWESFITGGVDGANAAVLPRWDPGGTPAVGSLWDYFGLPLVRPAGAYPLSFLRRAYNLVYNQYYRDETLIAEAGIDDTNVRLRSWEKDYFTSALPWQQRGTAPALPISGITSAVFPDANFVNGTLGGSVTVDAAAPPGHGNLRVGSADQRTNLKTMFNDNTVNMGSATTFNVADLRLAFQIQKWMERNARAGVRYTEFLGAHFGVAPRDDRLQRAEYLGGTRAPVIVSEVLQTAQSGLTGGSTPQGNMAGHGLTAHKDACASYRAEEFGMILGILSVMPRPMYSQGVDRQWLRTTKYDFYFPEFAHLSEQAVTEAELYATAVSGDNLTIFGYQGRFDEMRVKRNQVCALMRTGVSGSLDFWHLGRSFASAPGLNQAFIECDGTAATMRRIFAVTSQPGLIVSHANIVSAVRPLPAEPDPGLIDHS